MLPIMIPDILKSAPDLEPLIEAKLEDLTEVIPYIEEHFLPGKNYKKLKKRRRGMLCFFKNWCNGELLYISLD